MSEESILKKLADSILSFEEEVAKSAAQEALDAGVDPLKALEKGLKVGIDIVGDKFSRDELFLPHLLMAADALNAAVSVLKKNIPPEAIDKMRVGTIVIATVKDDIHDVGKNIVSALLSASGFEVHDLGKDVNVALIVDKAVAVDADIIMASALMTTTMRRQRGIIEELEFKGIRGQFLVMVGGGPTTQEWAIEIGADGYGKNAAE
ncbi:dimethylamine corrinoid protein 3, partial [Candidatus Bathyarchaeota archaeon]